VGREPPRRACGSADGDGPDDRLDRPAGHGAGPQERGARAGQVDDRALEADGARATAEHESALLPQAESAAREAHGRVRDAERALAQAEQLWQVEETRRGSSQRLAEQLGQRAQRLAGERAGLQPPDREALATMQEAVVALGAQLAEMRAGASSAEQTLAQGEIAAREAQSIVDAANRELTKVQARRDALEQLQSRLANAQATRDWAARHGLANARRLWQGLRIEEGWENALEAVLRERLNASFFKTGDRMRNRGD
jgi:chromosome segregation protein